MFLSFTESQKLQKAQKAHQKKRKRLFCRVCGSRISDMRYLTSVDGGSPNRVFRNPNGYLYEIITLSDCEGLQDTSPPILEETWFPGYPWVVLHCSSCLTHLVGIFQPTIIHHWSGSRYCSTQNLCQTFQ